jgi:hypothetical protein
MSSPAAGCAMRANRSSTRPSAPAHSGPAAALRHGSARGIPVDISPLSAATLAVWGLLYRPGRLRPTPERLATS